MKNTYFIIIGLLLVFAFASLKFASGGHPNVSTIENIYGIPFPSKRNAVIITEKLAHADIYLTNSPLAGKLTLTVTFIPHDTDIIKVGIRENSFWLSYPKHILYQAEQNPKPNEAHTGPITRTITIPLTDKIIDHNGSVDLMFFTSTDWATEYEGTADNTYWELNKIDAKMSLTRPAFTELKNYLRSKITREKPV